MDTHLAFSKRRSEVVDRILIPKFYDPDLSDSLRIASKEFDLPELGEILLPGSAGSRLGDWVRREEYGGGDIPYVRTSDLSHWRIRSDFKKGVSEELYDRLRAKQDVLAGDILMVAHGTYLVGDVAFVAPEDSRIVIQDHVFRLRVDSTKGLDAYLLLAALSTVFVKRQVRSRQFSADIIDKIGDRHLGIRVPIPKNGTLQREAAARVRNVLEAQSATREAIKEASESSLRMTRERAEAKYGFTVKRAAIRNRILIPKYYDPELEAELEEAVRVTGERWLSIGKLIADGVISAETGVEVGKMAYGTGTIPFIRTTDLVDWELKLDVRHGVGQEVYEAFDPKGTLAPRDVILVRDGTYLVGSSALVSPDDLPAMFCGGLYRLRVKKEGAVDPHTLLALLNLPLVRRQMRAKQFTRDVIDTLGHRLLEVTIPSPFGKTAQELAHQVEEIMRRKADLKRGIGETIRLIEPRIPSIGEGRPSWSMR